MISIGESVSENIGQEFSVLQEYVKNSEKIEKKDLEVVRKVLIIVLTSDEEYAFMRGKSPDVPKRMDILKESLK
jgi:hypothetical protein